MPYGMPKEMGGDSKKNTSWMENCVKKVMQGGKDKSSAVAICKATFEKMHMNKSSLYPVVQDLRKRDLTYLIQHVEEYFHSPEQD